VVEAAMIQLAHDAVEVLDLGLELPCVLLVLLGLLGEDWFSARSRRSS
jgi:hypothetical protein